ncbi:MAG: hypothetical protein K1X78_16315 [Verrucomicrobiaceae bacterium]|nr:hypothetical protein [Verrucomicrobiaceae bacterium]
MRWLAHITLALLACLAVPSCGLVGKGLNKMPWNKKKKNEAAKPDDGPHVIGTVELVNPEQRFVLIRTEAKVAMPAGQELTVLDATGARSKVKVTPEKKLDFLTADIVEGTPRVGGVAYFQLDRKAVPPADPNKPVTPSSPPPPPPVTPLAPPDQPPPITPVSSSEFLKPEASLPVPPPPVPRSASPIPPQRVPSPPAGSGIPVPGQIELPPVVR